MAKFNFNYDDYLNKIVERSRLRGETLSEKDFKNLYALYLKNDNGIVKGMYKFGKTDLDQMYTDYISQYGKSQTASDVAALQDAFAQLGIGAPEQLNGNGLNTNYQNYLDQLNALSDSQYAVAMDELQRSENEMYRAIGMSQRQMERDIAKRRQQALKSGMSTAQLAAQEQQNLLAAQTGATMLAQNYNNQRYNTINQFATARQQNLTDVLGQQINYSNTRQQNWDSTLANMYSQIYAANKYQK